MVGTCNICGEFTSLNEEGLCYDCERESYIPKKEFDKEQQIAKENSNIYESDTWRRVLSRNCEVATKKHTTESEY